MRQQKQIGLFRFIASQIEILRLYGAKIHRDIQTSRWFYRCFVFLVLLSIFSNFYHLERRHPFEWDQERDAKIVYHQIIQQKDPPLIGPRVVNSDGFFLGPLHFYILVPFFLLTQGDPVALAYLAGIVGVVQSIFFILLARRITNSSEAGLIMGLFSVMQPVLVSWNVMYMPILSLFVYAACLEILKKRYFFLAVTFVFLALAFQFHFMAVFLFLLVLIAFLLSGPQKQDIKRILPYIVVGLNIFLISFLPLVFFDLHHNITNTRLFVSFFLSSDNEEVTQKNVWEPLLVFLRSHNRILPRTYVEINVLVSVVLLQVFAWVTWKNLNRRMQIFHAAWVLIPLGVFSLYQGSISDYYFITISPVLFVYCSLGIVWIMQRWRVFGYSILAFLMVIHVLHTITVEEKLGLYYKKQAAAFIAEDTHAQRPEKPVNVEFDIPSGLQYGYEYILSYYGIVDSDQGEDYYTIVVLEENEGEPLVDKERKKRFGSILVIPPSNE